MAIYGTLFENTITNEAETNYYDENASAMTLTETMELNQDLLEVMMDLDEAGDIFEDFNFSLQEGANQDMTNAMRAHYGQIKNNIKSSKKKIKSKDYNGAKADLDKAKSELKQLETKIKGYKSTAGSAMIGVFAAGLLNCVELLCPTVIGLVGSRVVGTGAKNVIGNIANMATQAFQGASEAEVEQMAQGMVKGLVKTSVAAAVTFINNIYKFVKEVIISVKMIKQFINDLKDADVSTSNALNMYRNKLITYCTDLEKKITKTQKLIDKKSGMK